METMQFGAEWDVAVTQAPEVVAGEPKITEAEQSDSQTVTATVTEDKQEKAAERRNRKGYKILEFVRNFGQRASKKEIASEKQ